jgi:hypothetical protein
MKRNVRKRKVAARVELFARILDAAAHIKKREVNGSEKHAIFAHKSQSWRWDFRKLVLNCNKFVTSLQQNFLFKNLIK